MQNIDSKIQELKKLDLNLLFVLEVLLREKHVSRASKKLGMSQSATSRSLAKIRESFDDPLLVKSGQNYELSFKAQKIQPLLEKVLLDIAKIFENKKFTPKEVNETIKIFALDNIIVAYLPELIKHLKKKAPGLNISCYTGNMSHLSPLAENQLHFTISAMQSDDATSMLKRTFFAKEERVIMMSKKHKLAKKNISINDFINLDHGSININNTGFYFADIRLKELGYQRDISISLPTFATAAYYAESSNTTFVIPKKIGAIFSKKHEIVLKDLPREMGNSEITYYLYWHELNNSNPLCAWIRDEIKSFIQK